MGQIEAMPDFDLPERIDVSVSMFAVSENYKLIIYRQLSHSVCYTVSLRWLKGVPKWSRRRSDAVSIVPRGLEPRREMPESHQAPGLL